MKKQNKKKKTKKACAFRVAIFVSKINISTQRFCAATGYIRGRPWAKSRLWGTLNI